jgi:hypothetical protein
MKAKIADKNYCWKGSWKARCAVAVLNFNEGHEWKLALYTKLHFPKLSEHCLSVIIRKEKEAEKLTEKRSSKDFQKKERIRRVERRDQLRATAAEAKKKGIIHRQPKNSTVK